MHIHISIFSLCGNFKALHIPAKIFEGNFLGGYVFSSLTPLLLGIDCFYCLNIKTNIFKGHVSVLSLSVAARTKKDRDLTTEEKNIGL